MMETIKMMIVTMKMTTVNMMIGSKMIMMVMTTKGDKKENDDYDKDENEDEHNI